MAASVALDSSGLSLSVSQVVEPDRKVCMNSDIFEAKMSKSVTVKLSLQD